MAEIRAFPYERLPRLSRTEARAASAIARFVGAIDGRAALADASRVLGAPVHVAPTAFRVAAPGTIAAEAGASLGLVAGIDRGERAVVSLAPAIARVVADRVVGGTGAEVAAGPTPLTRGEGGLVGYVVGRVLRLASVRASLLDVASARDAIASLGTEPVLACALAVRIGPHEGQGLVVVPLRAAATLPAPPVAVAGDLPVQASLVIGVARLRAAQIAALGAGDVLIPDAISLDPRVADVGRARLVVGGRRAFDVELVEGRVWRVARRASIPAPRPSGAWSRTKKERAMSQPDTDPAQHSGDTVQSLGEVDIELSIELARLEMPVAEVAALAPGVVVTTGRLVGERVAVRAGDRVIAWGEIVDVEGEVGVRLTEVVARD